MILGCQGKKNYWAFMKKHLDNDEKTPYNKTRKFSPLNRSGEVSKGLFKENDTSLADSQGGFFVPKRRELSE